MLILQDIQYKENCEFALTQGTWMKHLRENHTILESIEEILGKFHGMTLVHYCWLQQGLLDGWITSIFQEINNNGTRYWKIPVDKTSNGFHHCTGCFPKEAWCNFPIFLSVTMSMMEISWTFWKYAERTIWHWIQIKCSADFQKFPSLDTLGVIRDYQLTQRRLKLWKEWNFHRIGNQEKFPWIDQLSQLIQPTSSWIKWPSQRDLQAENGIQAYKSLWGCISMLQRGNFQEHHTSILQSQDFHDFTDIQKWTWSCTTEFHTSDVCIQGIDWKWEELPKFGMRVFGNNMGHGKVPLLSLWQGVYFGDRPKATCIDIQETHGGNFSKDPEVSSEKLPISTFQC